MRKPKVKFYEYNTARKDQYFISVYVYYNNRWVPTGRVFREWDPEAKKYNYEATDPYGNKVFTDTKGLFDLKQQFIKYGESMAQAQPIRIQNEKMLIRLSNPQKPERTKELKDIREKKNTKEKTKEVSKVNTKGKTDENLKEKKQDAKNPRQYAKVSEQGRNEKDEMNFQSRENETAKENLNEAGKDQENIEPDSNEQFQDGMMDDETAERMEELEDLREMDNDLEEDLER